jgi:hypothetical protein
VFDSQKNIRYLVGPEKHEEKVLRPRNGDCPPLVKRSGSMSRRCRHLRGRRSGRSSH